MKLLRRLNTVYNKLFISFLLLVIMTTAIVSGTSYFFFTSSYNDEVNVVSGKLLEYQRKIIDENVFGKVEGIYLDIVNEQTRKDLLVLFDSSYRGNHAKVREVFQFLRSVAIANSDIIESVGIYYKENHMMISSVYGVKYLDDHEETAAMEQTWAERMSQSAGGLLWLDGGLNPAGPEQEDVVTFVGFYPYKTNGESSKGSLIIHIKKSGLQEWMKSSSAMEEGEDFLVDDRNRIIIGGLGPRWTGQDAFLQTLTDAGANTGHLLTDVRGQRSMVSYTTSAPTGWKLIHVTPVEKFYKNAADSQRKTILIAIIVIGIGVLCSQLISRKLYNPLKAIVHHARSFLSDAQPTAEPPRNEYVYINHLINNLSVKVDQLKSTLQSNMPLIKHHLVSGLLNQTIRTKQEVTDRLELLDKSMDNLHCACLLIQLNPEQMEQLSLENGEFVKFSLIQHIEEESPFALCMATELPGHKLAVIAGKQEGAQPGLDVFFHRISSYASSTFTIKTEAAGSRWIPDPLDLYQAGKDAEIMLAYHYFLTHQPYLSDYRLLQRDSSQMPVPQSYRQEFGKALVARDQDQAKKQVYLLVEELRNGPYSAANGHEEWRELIADFRTYLKSLHYSTSAVLPEASFEEFKAIRHIDQFRDWLCCAVDRVLQVVKNKELDGGIIESVKSYVKANVGEELSLQVVSDHVKISPNYLSKLFKEEVGVNFIDYVTEMRLEESKKLLLHRDDTVEQIALQVGFNSSAYFIKKFKQIYGMTPRNFKLQAIGEDFRKNRCLDRQGEHE